MCSVVAFVGKIWYNRLNYVDFSGKDVPYLRKLISILLCAALLLAVLLFLDAMPVFAHAEELVSMGLDIPDVTAVFLRLREMGLDVPMVYTIEQAVEVLSRMKGGSDLA